MLIASYSILKKGVPYKDLGPDYFLRPQSGSYSAPVRPPTEQLRFRVTLEKAA
jgi:hypothetical protein